MEILLDYLGWLFSLQKLEKASDLILEVRRYMDAVLQKDTPPDLGLWGCALDYIVSYATVNYDFDVAEKYNDHYLSLFNEEDYFLTLTMGHPNQNSGGNRGFMTF